jgi:hypothetical protein
MKDMKLIFCQECHDIVALYHKSRSCLCGKSYGQYRDEIKVMIGGSAIPLGFSNTSFMTAIENRPDAGLGAHFVAFVIPTTCSTVKQEF